VFPDVEVNSEEEAEEYVLEQFRLEDRSAMITGVDVYEAKE